MFITMNLKLYFEVSKMKEFINKINLFNCKTLPRKVFTFYFTALMLGTALLILPISRHSNEAPISFLDAIFQETKLSDLESIYVY